MAGNENDAKALCEKAHLRLQGCNCLHASSLDKAKQLCKEPSHQCAMGINKHLNDLDHTIDMLNRCRARIPCNKNKNRNNRNNKDTTTNRVAFAQATPGRDRRTFDPITCNKCGKKGHCANHCPEARNTSNINATDGDNNNNQEPPPTENDTSQAGSTQQGTGHLQMSRWNLFNGIITAATFLTFSQIMRDPLSLDNQSMDDIFCNAKHSVDIHRVKEPLQPVTNGGIPTTNMKGTFPGHGSVWFHPKAITNILSQSRVEDKGHTITCQ